MLKMDVDGSYGTQVNVTKSTLPSTKGSGRCAARGGCSPRPGVAPRCAAPSPDSFALEVLEPGGGGWGGRGRESPGPAQVPQKAIHYL